MALLLILRRLVALAIFIFIVVKFRRAARSFGATPWKWSALGVLTFYSTYFLVSIGLATGFVGIASLTPPGLTQAEQAAVPIVISIAIALAILSAFAATHLTLRHLIANVQSAKPQEPPGLQAP